MNDNNTLSAFLEAYTESGTARLHMPAHKGKPVTGCESLDITEIKGADYLYEAAGLIGESERRMSALYGTGRTIYSTEGSSICIKTMLGIIKSVCGKLRVLAGRNCHKAFIDGCALLDGEAVWVYPGMKSRSVCSSFITAEDIEKKLSEGEFDCVYITSPDYLGFMADIEGISKVCRKHGVPLLVDNAHGAYLRFTEPDMHPITLGADMCCDSAHKTLPCLTGTAMLHFSKSCPESFLSDAKRIMSVFGSTSPSYLLMNSLDKCSLMLSDGALIRRIRHTAERTALCKSRVSSYGFFPVGDEPMKITIDAALSGLTGNDLADKLREYGIEPEYSDPVYTVLMPSAMTTEDEFRLIEKAFSQIKAGGALTVDMPSPEPCERAVSIREAMFAPSEAVRVEDAEGRVCARTITGCQPAVPIAVSGELINENTVRLFNAYGINDIYVTK